MTIVSVPAGNTAGTTPRVLGLDLSLSASGIASTDGWCTTIGRSGITTQTLDQRLTAIDTLVDEILLTTGNPHLVVIEQPAFSRSGAGSLERHAMWWLIVRKLRNREIPVAEVTARGRMRYATGKGNATKGAIVDAVARRWPQFDTGGDDNLADAVVLAAMGADHLGCPLAKLPATHRAALDAVKWPEVAYRLAVAA